MKVKLLLIFSLLISVNLWANPTVFVVNNHSEIRSSKSETDNQNILKIVNKGQSLQRLTMHYSGWSLVAISDINGWILSSSLTSERPFNVVHNQENITNSEVRKLTVKLLNTERELLALKQTSAQLANTIVILNKSINDLTLENSILIHSKKVIKSSADNTTPERAERINTDVTQVTSMANLNINWIYTGILISGILLLALFFVFNRNKRRHFDLNTLRR